jgi:DNA mismatch repair protein MSH6
LKLDYSALLSLNILPSSGNNSLLGMLDRCLTPPGKRMLKEWVQFPLVEPADIIRRQSALQHISAHLSDAIYGQFGRLFKRLPDLERACIRIYSKKAKIKDYLAVLEGLEESNVSA